MIFNYIGNYSLIISLIFSLLVFFFPVFSYQKKNYLIDYKLLQLTFLQFFFILLSFLSLIILFLKSEFSNSTVFNNSHLTKPLFYKISGTWGNHEGSLLLWLLVLSLFIFLYQISSKKRPIKERYLTLIIQEIIIIGFLVFSLKNVESFSANFSNS